MSGQPYLEQPALHVQARYRAALLTNPGNLRQALADARADPKKTLLGVAQGIPSVFVTKVLASAKPDFIWMDVEHGIYDRSTLYDCIHAAQHHSEGHTLVVVRVPKHDEISLTTALDAGAAGIVIPHVETADEVRAFRKNAYFGPIGHRSFSPWTFTPGVSDASLYPDDGFNIQTASKHVCIIPQIESVKGVENIEEIAAVEGVDALMFGPGDFSIDAQIPLRLGGEPHPVFMDAMTKFVTTAHKFGIPLFGGAQVPQMVPMMMAQGYASIAVTFDVWGMATMVKDSIQAGRKFVEEAAAEAEEKAKGNGHAAAPVEGKKENGIATKALPLN